MPQTATPAPTTTTDDPDPNWIGDDWTWEPGDGGGDASDAN